MLAFFSILGICGLLAATAPVLAQNNSGADTWTAERQAIDLNAAEGSMTLVQPVLITGGAADVATQKAIVAAAQKLFPLASVQDRMSAQPAGTSLEPALYALAQLARLESGRASITRGVFSIVGKSQAADDSTAVASSIVSALPTTLKAGSIAITPATVENYSWSATRMKGAIRFDGYVPSVQAKAELATDAKARFPGIPINDYTVVANGAPNAFLPAARVGLNQLEHADAGLAKISGTDYSIFARVPERNGVSADALTSALRTTATSALPEGFSSKVISVSPGAIEEDPRSVDFLYATDRVRKDQPLTIGFDFNRSNSLTLGVARVHVPEGHGIGKIELPNSGFSLFGVTWGGQTADPKKHFVIKSIEVLTPDQWKALAAGNGKEALIFVHGYNTKFEDAVFRTAQIVWDLQYHGTAVLFSWPSRGELLSYEWDRNSALVARAHFIQLLNILKNEAGVEKINIIAHSMGNLVVLDALSSYAQTSDPLKIGQLIMAAPDVDLDQYRQAIPNISKIVSGMTLYASAADKAMLTSRTLAQGARAGDISNGSPAVVEGVDAIDVTAIGDELLGMDHATFADSRSVIDDIAQVLQGKRPPDLRLAQIRAMPEGVTPPLFWRYAN